MATTHGVGCRGRDRQEGGSRQQQGGAGAGRNGGGVGHGGGEKQERKKREVMLGSVVGCTNLKHWKVV